MKSTALLTIAAAIFAASAPISRADSPAPKDNVAPSQPPVIACEKDQKGRDTCPQKSTPEERDQDRPEPRFFKFPGAFGVFVNAPSAKAELALLNEILSPAGKTTVSAVTTPIAWCENCCPNGGLWPECK